jgi:hemoglobin
MTESPQSTETAENSVLDDSLIMKLMHAFYAKVRVDPLLGPIFDARIQDWEPHLARIGDFWSAVMLRSGRYQGQPMRLHLPLPIDATHFDRWLELFEGTAREVCSAAVAERFIQRARTIGRSLEMGVAAANGVMLPPGERYARKSTRSRTPSGRS